MTPRRLVAGAFIGLFSGIVLVSAIQRSTENGRIVPAQTWAAWAPPLDRCVADAPKWRGLIIPIPWSSAVLHAAEVEQPPAILKARIAQLEEQVRQLQRSAQICAAQLLLANQSQADKEAQAKLDAAAKEMGCEHGADWSAIPPVCLKDKS